VKNDFTIDTSNFDRAVRELANLSGKSVDDVLRSEIASIIATTINKTTFATEQSIGKSNASGVYIRDPQNPIYQGGRIVQLNWRIKDYQWALLQSKLAEQVRRIGITKQSWLRLADKMGLSLVKPRPTRLSKIESASANGKKIDAPVSYSRQISQNSTGYEIKNSMRSALRGGGGRILLQAINGRTGFFYNNLRNGVFSKMATIAKKYPGFQIDP